MKVLKISMITTIVMLCVAGGAFIYFWMPFYEAGEPLVLDKARTSSGIRFCLIQTYTGIITEPYQVSFYYRFPGRQWKWCYIDHEALYWHAGKIKLNGAKKLATVYHGDQRVAVFDWHRKRFFPWNDAPVSGTAVTGNPLKRVPLTN